MKRPIFHNVFPGILLLCGGIGFLQAQTLHREITRSKERELSVTVDVSFGRLSVERGEKDKVVVIDYEDEKDDKEKLSISYDISGDKGKLKIKSKKSSHVWGDDDSDDRINDRKLRLRFSDAMPISFELELGAGIGDINLSGLQVKHLKVSTGASSVELQCDEPNPIDAESVEIESGVSKFTASNLCNVNFRTLKFSGGVGAYKLDFGGKLRQDASVHIEVGLGSVIVNVPRHVAARLLYDDNWFSTFSLDSDFSKRRGGVYETENYEDAEKRLTIQIESGLGSVKVRRSR
jgi:hypothetical protein